MEDSLKGYYSHVKYMPEHVARRWHAVRKGADVKLGKEHLAATSQSDNARHGYVPGGSGGRSMARPSKSPPKMNILINLDEQLPI